MPLLSKKRSEVTQDTDSILPLINLDQLIKLRLVVGRYGEMDLARWWNTQGMLGRRGAVVLRRGVPFTHYFAQARVVFAVAGTRCHELFDPPGCITLWSLPAEVEDQFEAHWQGWLDQDKQWEPFFERLCGMGGDDLLKILAEFELVSRPQIDQVSRLRRSAENRAVPLPGEHEVNDDVITLLAAGFARGEPGSPAIPYTRVRA